MTAENILKQGRFTAIGTFLGLTTLLGIYYKTANKDCFYWAIVFIVLAFAINFWVASKLMNEARKSKDAKDKRFVRTFFLMCFNLLPISIFGLLAFFLSLMIRVTFVNTSDSVLTHIEISGCSETVIDKLEVGESRELWLKGFFKDCPLDLSYQKAGQTVQENLTPNAIVLKGMRLKYKMGEGLEK